MPPFTDHMFYHTKNSSKSSCQIFSHRPENSCTTFDIYADTNDSLDSLRRNASRSSRSSDTSYKSVSTVSRSSRRYDPYKCAATSSGCVRYSSQSASSADLWSHESQLDYYTRTAPSKYKRRIARHVGIVHSPRILENTCAATQPGQKTCTHASTTAGDIVNYIPTGSDEDIRGDLSVPSKLSMHFMVLLPSYYKPVELQKKAHYHAALVISSHPIGPSTLLAPQPNHEYLKGINVPILQTVCFDAHSKRRAFVDDDKEKAKWEWKANTSVGFQVKIVHQDNLHAIIYPGHPTYGLRLGNGAFEQVLKELGEDDDELENARSRDVEYWGKADKNRRDGKSSCLT